MSDLQKPIALVTSDSNPNYTEFEDIVKEFWTEIGFEPVYLRVGVDYPEVTGIPTSLQAQILRLYAASQYPGRVVLLSDMDMLPLCGEYFRSKLPTDTDKFSIYSADAYPLAESNFIPKYPMCYVASYSENYNLFRSSSDETWEAFVQRLYALDLGWITDEIYMSEVLTKHEHRLVKYNRGWKNNIASARFDRVHWNPNLDKYLDAHCPRPYSQYKIIIDSLRSHITK